MVSGNNTKAHLHYTKATSLSNEFLPDIYNLVIHVERSKTNFTSMLKFV